MALVGSLKRCLHGNSKQANKTACMKNSGPNEIVKSIERKHRLFASVFIHPNGYLIPQNSKSVLFAHIYCSRTYEVFHAQ